MCGGFSFVNLAINDHYGGEDKQNFSDKSEKNISFSN